MKNLKRKILVSNASRYLIRKSHEWVLPGFEGVCLYDVLTFFSHQMSRTGIRERASSIAYNFIMSLPPSCLFLFTLIPNLPFISKRSIKRQLHGLIMDIVPGSDYNTGLIKFVDSIFDGSKIGLISSGFLLSLFFASNAIMGVMRSFNKDYVGFEHRNALQKRWTALKLTGLLFSLVLTGLILLVSQRNLLIYLGIKNELIRGIIVNGRWIVITGLVYYSFAFIYRYAPATEKRWRLLSPGAIVATFLSILATVLFSIFVNNFGRYNVLYGSIGTIMVVMILIFINSLVILIGFEFNVSIKTLKAKAEERKLVGFNHIDNFTNNLI
ncbi:MAG: YihY/virulence factor BrkB family protein [Ginsengibacter sp.]